MFTAGIARRNFFVFYHDKTFFSAHNYAFYGASVGTGAAAGTLFAVNARKEILYLNRPRGTGARALPAADTARSTVFVGVWGFIVA